jgi:hypothetical protein
MYIYTFLLRTPDTMTSQNIEYSSFDTPIDIIDINLHRQAGGIPKTAFSQSWILRDLNPLKCANQFIASSQNTLVFTMYMKI